MIRIIIILALAAAALIVGPIAAGNKGYVLIAMGNWTAEMSVVSLVISLLVIFIAFLLVEFVLKKLLRISNDSVLWLSNRKQKKALKLTSDGMLAIAAEDWRNAEKLLTQSAKNSQTPALNYLGAAEAAKKQGRLKQTQAYVEKVGSAALDTLAVAMTKARLADHQAAWQKSKEELELWQKKQPKHAPLLMQLAQIYRHLALWADWVALLPALKKHAHLPEEILKQQTQEAYSHYFQQLAQDDPKQLHLIWKQLDKNQQRQPELIASYSHALAVAGEATMAEELIFTALCKELSSPLLNVWAKLSVHQPEELLLKAKKRFKKGSALHASFVGLTALHAKRYDEAIRYLLQAVEIEADIRDQKALALAYELNQQPLEALKIYTQVT